MDMDFDIPRGRSTIFSTNSFRALSTHSNLFSIPYVERIEAQSNDLSQTKQVKLNEMKEIILLYTTPKLGENKSTNETTDPTPEAREEYSNNETTILNNTLNL